MKFLLVVPRFINKVGQYYEFPLGLAYISSSLKKAGHTVECLNLNHIQAWPKEAVRQAIEEFDPDVCGSGTLSPHFNQISVIFDAARAAKPNIVNIVGGGVFSGDPQVMSEVLDIDYGVVGEGDQSVLDVANVLDGGGDPEAVPGIGFRDSDGRFHMTSDNKPIHDLESICWPDYEGFGLETYLSTQRRSDNYFFHLADSPRSLPMIASRSCPFNCTFCFHPTGRLYRKRSLDALFEEIDYLVDRYNPNLISFLDELFALKKQDLLDFCERIRPYGIKWMVNLHVSSADAEVISAMKKAGCLYIGYGIENVSSGILKSMDKKSTLEQIENALELNYRYKVGIQGNIIFGDPEETFETVNENLAWWAKNRKYQINMNRLQVYPGSIVYKNKVEDGTISNPQKQLYEPSLNVTGIDEASTVKMRMKLMVTNETLLLPARILKFERSEIDNDPRGENYHIVAECPHCGETCDYDNILFDAKMSFQSLRMTCAHCYARMDVQNLARKPVKDAKCDSLFEEAERLRATDDLGRVLNIYEEILRTSFRSDLFDRPDSYVRAAYETGMLFLERGNDPESAVYHLGRALYFRAYDPEYHLAFARALVAEGCLGAAKMHFEQVLRLVNTDDPAMREKLDPIRDIAESIPTDVPYAYVRPAKSKQPVAAE